MDTHASESTPPIPEEDPWRVVLTRIEYETVREHCQHPPKPDGPTRSDGSVRVLLRDDDDSEERKLVLECELEEAKATLSAVRWIIAIARQRDAQESTTEVKECLVEHGTRIVRWLRALNRLGVSDESFRRALWELCQHLHPKDRLGFAISLSGRIHDPFGQLAIVVREFCEEKGAQEQSTCNRPILPCHSDEDSLRSHEQILEAFETMRPCLEQRPGGIGTCVTPVRPEVFLSRYEQLPKAFRSLFVGLDRELGTPWVGVSALGGLPCWLLLDTPKRSHEPPSTMDADLFLHGSRKEMKRAVEVLRALLPRGEWDFLVDAATKEPPSSCGVCPVAFTYRHRVSGAVVQVIRPTLQNERSFSICGILDTFDYDHVRVGLTSSSMPVFHERILGFFWRQREVTLCTPSTDHGFGNVETTIHCDVDDARAVLRGVKALQRGVKVVHSEDCRLGARLEAVTHYGLEENVVRGSCRGVERDGRGGDPDRRDAEKCLDDWFETFEAKQTRIWLDLAGPEDYDFGVFPKEYKIWLTPSPSRLLSLDRVYAFLAMCVRGTKKVDRCALYYPESPVFLVSDDHEEVQYVGHLPNHDENNASGHGDGNSTTGVLFRVKRTDDHSSWPLRARLSLFVELHLWTEKDKDDEDREAIDRRRATPWKLPRITTARDYDFNDLLPFDPALPIPMSCSSWPGWHVELRLRRCDGGTTRLIRPVPLMEWPVKNVRQMDGGRKRLRERLVVSRRFDATKGIFARLHRALLHRPPSVGDFLSVVVARGDKTFSETSFEIDFVTTDDGDDENGRDFVIQCGILRSNSVHLVFSPIPLCQPDDAFWKNIDRWWKHSNCRLRGGVIPDRAVKAIEKARKILGADEDNKKEKEDEDEDSLSEFEPEPKVEVAKRARLSLRNKIV